MRLSLYQENTNILLVFSHNKVISGSIKEIKETISYYIPERKFYQTEHFINYFKQWL